MIIHMKSADYSGRYADSDNAEYLSKIEGFANIAQALLEMEVRVSNMIWDPTNEPANTYRACTAIPPIVALRDLGDLDKFLKILTGKVKGSIEYQYAFSLQYTALCINDMAHNLCDWDTHGQDRVFVITADGVKFGVRLTQNYNAHPNSVKKIIGEIHNYMPPIEKFIQRCREAVNSRKNS